MSFKNEAAFSDSRAEVLNQCPRRYYYQVYLMWGGWHRGAHARVRTAYVLKHAQTAYSWAGSIVHDFAQHVLMQAKAAAEIRQDRPLPELNRVEESIIHKVQQGLIEAKSGRHHQDPKNTLQLQELAEGQDVDEAWVIARVTDSIRKLLAPDEAWPVLGDKPRNILTWVASQRASMIDSVEDLRRVTIDGKLAFVKVDLALRSRNQDEIVIVDWKTGQPKEEDLDQVALYGAAYQPKFKKARLLLVYLGSNKIQVEQRDRDTEDCYTTASTRVRDFFADLQPRLKGQDLNRNEAEPANFPPAKTVEPCRFCPFKVMCRADGGGPW